MCLSKNRWISLCLSLDLQPDLSVFNRFQDAYSEPHRAYHTIEHLKECLAHLDWAIAEHGVPQRALAEMALWFHDAVYRPRATDNELQSANWGRTFLHDAGLSTAASGTVHALIMATRHNEPPQDTTQQFVVDIDLSILGAAPERFGAYEQQIRREYKWVPWFLYKKKRKEVLQHFLSATRIYNTEVFYATYESQARDNLARSIAQLS